MTSGFSFAQEFAQFGDDLMGKAYDGKDVLMQVLKVTPGQSAKGKQKFAVTLAFVTGPNKGKQITETLYWSPENDTAARIFAQTLNVLGATPKWIKDSQPSPDQIATKMEGQRVQVDLTPGEFNGQPQTRVRFKKNMAPAGGAAAKTQVATLDDEPAEPVSPAAKAIVPDEPEEPITDPDNPWG